ncbi:hypothetical protein G3N59_00575 [Paraburkholderia sp. Ac-20340]|uniref:hypothetical protein n=1 Tax=Paraburkholderia sp. Ac-20340 TaxID=2703888 RepID=UPI00197DAB89|nr:hypothetical protein [Paraburkholderia sp. Ac-20340]MBN3851859.1 hypothetical protein [Paraburkholderia sp. Ac-20340]
MTENSVVSIALDNIANAHREGAHVIFSERNVAEHLLSIGESLGGRTKQTLRNVINRYAQLAEFAETVEVKIFIGLFDNIHAVIENGKRFIKIPVACVTSSLLQKPYLLVENIDDAKFYGFLTTELASKLNFSGHLSFEAYNGGGNTTGNVYEHLKNSTDRLCLCIVDSDRRFPTSKPGETANKVLASDKTDPSPLTESFVLPVCSVENLIPWKWLEDAYSQSEDMKKRLKMYECHHVDDVWPFLQLKKDIRCADLRETQKAFSVFWSDKLKCRDDVARCVAGGACTKRDDCSTTFLAAVSGSPLGAVIPKLSERTIGACDAVPTVKAAWQSIAQLVSAWSCGGPQLSAG